MKKTSFVLAFISLLLLSSCSTNSNGNSSSDNTISNQSINTQTSSNISSSISEEVDNENITVLDNSSNRLVLNVDTTLTYSVKYKLSSSSSYINLDNECINDKQVIILGLLAGKYDVQVTTSDNKISYLKNIQVEKQDASGYATFNKTSIGAYNIDGSLLSNSKVIYVNDTNKNTVNLTVGSKTYTGLGNIIANINKIDVPLDIRIIGSINTNQFKIKTFIPFEKGEDPSTSYPERFQNELETTYTNLDGLTNKIFGPSSSSYDYKTPITFSKKTSYKDTDSAFNMMMVRYASNLTIEGLFNGTINQWGFNFYGCNSIEVRNLTFKDYPEDACSFEGASDSASTTSSLKDITKYSNFFLHNNTFLVGKNNWDLTQEQDKKEGDGSSDIKYLSNYTSSYNHFVKCHKTGLVGGGDTQMTQNVTFHHNYYEEVSSRLPLGRQANMHIYNCYYKGCGTGQDIRANGFVLSEANYFESTNYPQKVTINASKSYYPAIKSYNDKYVSCKSSSQATKVTNRTDKVSNGCKPNGIDLSNFDTDSTLFYYDSINNVSKVELLHSVDDVPSFVKAHSGNLY